MTLHSVDGGIQGFSTSNWAVLWNTIICHRNFCVIQRGFHLTKNVIRYKKVCETRFSIKLKNSLCVVYNFFPNHASGRENENSLTPKRTFCRCASTVHQPNFRGKSKKGIFCFARRGALALSA